MNNAKWLILRDSRGDVVYALDCSKVSNVFKDGDRLAVVVDGQITNIKVGYDNTGIQYIKDILKRIELMEGDVK